ncbi:MAG: hypothetical protein OET41_08990 [Xanthomonadales bacterium]|jgi:hypothetical protein|nr:hypothetical protein [Xanthomonadales bacterium]
MKKLIALLICFLLATPLAAQQSLTAEAQRNVNISRKMVDDKRNTQIAMFMSFSQEEKEKFWPLYREYREAMAGVGDKRLAVIVDYANNVDRMTDPLAKQLLDRSFKVDKEFIQTKERYVKKFRRILPDIKVVRLMQLENRMDIAVDMKVAEGIPLMK